jgi:hypothetical protein
VLLDRAGVVGIDLFDDTGDALPDVSVVLEQSEVFSRRSGNTDASGRISFPGVAPGVYTIAVRENTETVTVRPGVDLDFRYRISSGGDLVPLSPDRPLVEGSVWTSGEPAVGASVLLAPRETGAEAALFRVLATDVEGRFALRETLPDGSYRIMAFDSLPAGWADDPSFVSRYESLGRLVELSSDTHSRVELRLISEP